MSIQGKNNKKVLFRISSYEDHLENHTTQKSSKTGSVDSLLLVVFDQVYSNLSNMLNNFAGPPPSASNNMSDFTFLLDSEGYTIVEFQAKIFDIIYELPYACRYEMWLLYFFQPFLKTISWFSMGFFIKIWYYVWLVLKSSF